LLLDTQMYAERAEHAEALDHWIVGTTFGDALAPKRLEQLIERRDLIASTSSLWTDDYVLPLLTRDLFLRFHELPSDALFQFLALNEGDESEALSFTRAYGVFDSSCRTPDPKPSTKPRNPLEGAVVPPPSVRARMREYHHARKTPFALPVEHMWEAYRRIGLLLAISQAVREGDHRAVAEIAPHLVFHPRASTPKEWLDLGGLIFRVQVSAEINAETAGVRVVPAESQRKFFAAITGTTLRPALFVQLLAAVAGQTAAERCENQSCRKWFVVTRGSKRFCSVRCQSLVKVQRFRGKTVKK
jgi:hypothetical protein